tara:strand:- start:467 stop:1513 length:1047 start_codon:yes stop_codon:yes gene_type:complete
MFFENPFLFYLIIPIIATWFLLDIVRKASIKLRFLTDSSKKLFIKKIIPTTGGVALCISWLFIIFINIFFVDTQIESNLYIYALSGVVIAVVGFYDDINELPSLVKLLMQILVFFILINAEDALINSFNGLFKINELNQTSSLIISLIFFLVIINSFNSILKSDHIIISISIIFLSVVSYHYYKINYQYFPLIISFLCSLITYFIFSFLTKRRINLGYTGSLGLGLTIATISISWLNFNHPIHKQVYLDNFILLFILVSYPSLNYIYLILKNRFSVNNSFQKNLRSNSKSKIYYLISFLFLAIYILSLILINNYLFDNIINELKLIFNIILMLLLIYQFDRYKLNSIN